MNASKEANEDGADPGSCRSAYRYAGTTPAAAEEKSSVGRKAFARRASTNSLSGSASSGAGSEKTSTNPSCVPATASLGVETLDEDGWLALIGAQ